MRFVSLTHENRPALGRVDGDLVRVAPAARWSGLRDAIAADALAALAETCDASGVTVPLAAAALRPVIPDPGKILCIGVNYEAHRRETGRAEAGKPTVFVRFPDTLVGHGERLRRPSASAEYDFEGELAVVIGRPGRAIPRARALAHVAGYACFMDGSVRDFQRHSHQFTPGKNFPRSGAFGPWLVTADAVPSIDALHLVTRVNGAVVQESGLDHLIFDVPSLIAYCSIFTELRPGDVIATGTPGGVGARRDPPLWLAAGDVVEVAIEGVGVLRNTVADEEPDIDRD